MTSASDGGVERSAAAAPVSAAAGAAQPTEASAAIAASAVRRGAMRRRLVWVHVSIVASAAIPITRNSTSAGTPSGFFFTPSPADGRGGKRSERSPPFLERRETSWDFVGIRQGSGRGQALREATFSGRHVSQVCPLPRPLPNPPPQTGEGTGSASAGPASLDVARVGIVRASQGVSLEDDQVSVLKAGAGAHPVGIDRPYANGDH